MSFSGFALGARICDVELSTPLDKLETRMLIMHTLQLTRVQLITQDQYVFTEDELQKLFSLITRRIAGEPIAYLIGQREFFGLSFYVTPDVLIPRADTELLVELAIEHTPPNGQLLDLGTGSGAIAIAVAYHRPDIVVTAVDVSQSALNVARKNAEHLLTSNNTCIQFLQSDWFSQLNDKKFSCIVANPPYIVKDDIHLSQGDLRFEPIDALTDHANGLTDIQSIIYHAHHHLLPNAWLMIEHGYHQAAEVRDLFTQKKYANVTSWRDLAMIERVTGGQTIY